MLNTHANNKGGDAKEKTISGKVPRDLWLQYRNAILRDGLNRHEAMARLVTKYVKGEVDINV